MRADVSPPIMVDLGTARASEIEQLLASTGPLGNDVQEVLRFIGPRIDAESGRRRMLPVVVIYSKRDKTSKHLVRTAW